MLTALYGLTKGKKKLSFSKHETESKIFLVNACNDIPLVITENFVIRDSSRF